MDIQVCQELTELMDLPVLMVRPAHLDLMALPEELDHQVKQELMEHRDPLDLLEPIVRKGLPDLVDVTELMAYQELMAAPAHRVLLE